MTDPTPSPPEEAAKPDAPRKKRRRGVGGTLSSLVLGNPDPAKAFRRGPLRASSGAILAASGLGQMVLAPIAGAIREMITGDELEQARRRTTLLMEARRQRVMEEQRIESKRQYVQMNAQRLMQMAPDITNRVLAGRRITQGGVAIGGTPRIDLLQELAAHMSDGSLK